jgi:hypothetical protein
VADAHGDNPGVEVVEPRRWRPGGECSDARPVA